MGDLIQPRGYTEADWLGAQGDPVLEVRELGFVIDTGEHVLGDGATAFSGLTRYGGSNGASLARFKAGYYYSTPTDGNATMVLPNERLVVVPMYIWEETTLDRIGLRISSAGESGAKIRLGIYDTDADGMPDSLLVDAGQVAADAATAVEATISLDLPKGLVWLAAAVQSAPTTQPTVLANNGNFMGVIGSTSLSTITDGRQPVYRQESVTGALPASWGATYDTSNPAPRLAVRAA